MDSSKLHLASSRQDAHATNDDVVLLATRSVPPSYPARQPSPLVRVDWLLASFVVLLAFLVASTPARNSDVWLHLATGRAIADGSYRFQGDPFAQDENVWIVHSWLYDLITFEIFTRFAAFGGVLLVILKSLLVAFLAGLLVRLGTRDRGLAWPTFAATLSVLAMSGRLLLQPALLSLVLLAVTLALLQRGRRMRGDKQSGWLRCYGPIVPLFALWANLDEWFLLGPLTVGLCLVGDILAAVAGGDERKYADPIGLAGTLAAGLLACVLTPFHVHGFTVPVELGLSATAFALEADPVLRNLFVSPFDGTYFHSGTTWNLPALAYLALAVLSGLSFLTSGHAWRSWRLPVWLGFFGLSAWSVRAVPFFAVVAGPILAWNVQDFASRYRPDWLRRDEFRYARLGRVVALLSLFALLVAAWPGWLQGGPYEMRRWCVLADPSLRAAAEQLAAWRSEGQLTEMDRGFNFAPEAANYFAWFCPAEKGIVDTRLNVSPAVISDYVALRRSLLDDTPNQVDWRNIFRARQVNHVVLYDSNPERKHGVYRHLLRHAEEWFPIELTGRTVIFGWQDPRHETKSLKSLRLSFNNKAYHPIDAEKAPLEWPGRGPQPQAWWRPFASARADDASERDKAALLLIHFETLRESNFPVRLLAWETTRIAGAIGGGGGTLSVRAQQILELSCCWVLHNELPLDAQGRVTRLASFALEIREENFKEEDDGPPALLWLAIRAARKALHQNPDDAHAYLILGEAYLDLDRKTRERGRRHRIPLLGRLRAIQASAAFNQALLVDPDLLEAHAGLATLYQSMGQLDLQLRHMKEVLRLQRAHGCPRGETLQEWEQRLASLQDELTQLEEQHQRIENNYEINAANLKIIDRAHAAQIRGLGGKALDILLKSDAATFGPRGVQMELDLLLTTGRVADARAWMMPEHKQTLGMKTYLVDRLLLAAACGDYERADEELAELANQKIRVDKATLTHREAISTELASELLEARLQNQSLFDLCEVPYNRMQRLGKINAYVGGLQQQTEATVLRGILALECGETKTAQTLLRRALDTYRSADAVREGAGVDFGGRLLAEFYWKRLSMPPR